MSKKAAKLYKKTLNDRGEEILLKGTKIPLTFFFDYIIEGYNISDFLSSYPWVKKGDLKKKLAELKEKTASMNAL